MEDEKTQHNNLSLLHLNLPPPDQGDALLGFFSHGASNPADHLLLPNYPPPLIPSSTTTTTMYSTSSFIAAPDMCPPSHVDPAHALIINSNVGVMGGKRRKMMNKLGESAAILEKPARDVIHVRAKRGQATDSHSLAERVRRERINDKLKLLQDLVPGCYKTMGMAVMLDVIINYVRSLQNQIEFLSMKLSAASMFYDFNSPEAEAMEALQRTNPCEAREMERLMREEGFDQVLAPADHDLHSTWRF